LQAAVNFVKNSGKKAIITSPENAMKALNNKAGTHIVRWIKIYINDWLNLIKKLKIKNIQERI